MNIVETNSQTIAFTQTNAPRHESKRPTQEQLEAQAAKMNGRAAKLGIQARYEVRA